MPKLNWTDASGRIWPTFLDVPAVVRLRSAGYDLKDNDRLAAIFADSYDAADFAVEVHRPLWTEEGLTEIEFLALMTDTPERLESVITAVVEALIDFFHRFRDVLRASVVRTALQAAYLAETQIRRKLDSPKVDQAIQAEMDRRMADVDDTLDAIISGEISGSSSGSLEFTPRVLPFDRSQQPSRGNVLPIGTTLRS